MAGFVKCCYCINLSIGCYIIGVLYMIFCLSNAIVCSMYIIVGKARFCYLAWGENYTLTTFMTIVFAVATIISGLMLVFASLFMVGLASDRGWMLLLFMAYLFLYHAINFFLLMIVACGVNSWILFLLALLNIGVLWLLTVYSEYTLMPTMEEEEMS